MPNSIKAERKREMEVMARASIARLARLKEMFDKASASNNYTLEMDIARMMRHERTMIVKMCQLAERIVGEKLIVTEQDVSWLA